MKPPHVASLVRGHPLAQGRGVYPSSGEKEKQASVARAAAEEDVRMDCTITPNREGAGGSGVRGGGEQDVSYGAVQRNQQLDPCLSPSCTGPLGSPMNVSSSFLSSPNTALCTPEGGDNAAIAAARLLASGGRSQNRDRVGSRM